MTSTELLERVASIGVTLRVTAGRIAAHPASSLPPELRAAIATHKAALLVILDPWEGPGPDPRCPNCGRFRLIVRPGEIEPCQRCRNGSDTAEIATLTPATVPTASNQPAADAAKDHTNTPERLSVPIPRAASWLNPTREIRDGQCTVCGRVRHPNGQRLVACTWCGCGSEIVPSSTQPSASPGHPANSDVVVATP